MNTNERPDLAVTGATGAVGGLVARALAEAGVAQRLVVRDPGRAPDLPGAAVVTAEYDDRIAAERALAGIRTLLMVSAAENADRVGQHRTFVEAAAAAGVRHVVYTSFVGAAPDAVFTLGRDHWATEQMIIGAGLDHTFLRDNLYLDFAELLAGADGVIRGPAGDGRAAMVARADVARAAVAVLQDPAAHAGRRYDLTGPEALTLTEIAATLSAARGTAFGFHDESLAEAYASRQVFGAPGWQVGGVGVDLHLDRRGRDGAGQRGRRGRHRSPAGGAHRAARRVRGPLRSTRVRQTVRVLAVVYLAMVAVITLSPAQSTNPGGPLLWVTQWLARSPVTSWLTLSRFDFTANVIMFVPFGVLVGLLLGPRRWWLVLVLAAASTVAIETAQLFIPNRVSDVHDLIANTAGAAIGLGLIVTVRLLRARRTADSLPRSAA